VGDEQWSKIIDWVIDALLLAEEHGVTSTNMTSKRVLTDPILDRLLGPTRDFGAPLGLEDEWAVYVVERTGNYGEIYDRAYGENSSRKWPRGLNRLSADGGLLVPRPLK
jgi:general L-amino acid transport system substrate-binding protein